MCVVYVRVFPCVCLRVEKGKTDRKQRERHYRNGASYGTLLSQYVGRGVDWISASCIRVDPSLFYLQVDAMRRGLSDIVPLHVCLLKCG